MSQSAAPISTAPSKSSSLLIELLTEELPPKSLWRLAQSFAENILAGLQQHQLASDAAVATPFATPRRLAVRIDAVYEQQPDGTVRKRGPAVASGLTEQGQPTPALLGFLKSCSITFDKLTQEEQNGHLYFFFEAKHIGKPLAEYLGAILETAVKKLPISKTMRWGASTESFVRPVHSVVALYGNQVVPLALLSHQSGRETRGHRLMATRSSLSITNATTYENELEAEGYVIANYEDRKNRIKEALLATLQDNEVIVMPPALLDEVCGLVEYPVVLRGNFDERFLAIPKEVLILSMQTHQRYFAIENKEGNLTPSFLLVSNIRTEDPSKIIEGNQRVLRARLSDAQFFFQQDKKTPLRERAKQLKTVIYHQKLGTQAERVERVKQLAIQIYAPFRNAWQLPPDRLEEAIDIAKADLLSDMVGEFPELQGVIGSYYAEQEGFHPNIVLALREQYQLKFDGLTLAPAQRERALLSVVIRVADRIETLVGLYGIGLIPTGDRDPFALRRCAFVILDSLEWLCQEARAGRLAPLRLPAIKNWLNLGMGVFAPGKLTESGDAMFEFILERVRQRLTQDYPAEVVEAVLSSPASVAEARLRVEALSKNIDSAALRALAQAHKRVQNLLKKTDLTSLPAVDPIHFQSNAEQSLWDALQALTPNCESMLSTLHIEAAIDTLAELAAPVDRFFNEVMVMADNPVIRANRLALLATLDGLILSVAHLAVLA
ncbi:MAG: glycine--tRNA ligase subunit beta [Pseudomonadota bacterium]